MRISRGLRLASVMVASAMVFTACGDDETPSPPAGGGGTTPPATTSAPAKADFKVGLVYDLGGRGDKSFNDAAAVGLDKAKAELGIEAQELEPSGGGENRGELLQQLAESDFAYNVAVGFLFTEAVKKSADANPNVTFGIVDAVLDDSPPEKKKYPNVKQMTFAEHEGSFLVGAAAALKSKKGKIGFVGGVEIDLIKKFEAGYVAGAKAAKPDIQIDVKYITQPPNFDGFRDPAKGKEIAKGMYDGGADVVYHAAGGSGTGVFEAAKDASGGKTGEGQMWAIGVDSDQYEGADAALKPYILTSMLKRVDVAVYESIKAFAGGDKSGGIKHFDLKADGVGYSKSGGFVDDIATQLDDYKAKIISGEIKVPDKP